MKILLFGCTGQLGWELQRSLAPLGEVIAPSRVGANMDPHAVQASTGPSAATATASPRLLQAGANPAALSADFARPDALADLVGQVAPDVIVNAAAYTNVDGAESEPELADTVNSAAPGALSHAAAACGALIVHYSTDYVFDGNGRKPLTEKDPTGPLSAYGRSKLKGERAVTRHCPRHLIFRTGWIYGLQGDNFAKAILRQAARSDQLKVVDDQYGAPTGAELLADVTAHAVLQTLADPVKAGLYHLAAEGETTRNAYARFLITEALAAGHELTATAERVERIATSAQPSSARRPRYTRLDCSKLSATFGLRMPPWERGVARFVQELRL